MAKGKQKTEDLDLSEDFEDRAEGMGEQEVFLQNVREMVAEGVQFWGPIWDVAEDDVNFRLGDSQWPAEALAEREAAQRPALVFNDLPQFLEQVTGDQRQNPTSIKVSPADDIVSKGKLLDVNGKEYKIAEGVEGLVRNIEYKSKAADHYDTAFEHAVEGGFGWLRVLTEYANPTSFDLDIRIKSIANRWSVLVDPNFQEPDASDINWGMIASQMSRHMFEKHYPNGQVGEIMNLENGWWRNDDSVTVAELFMRRPAKRTLVMLQSGEIVWKDMHKDEDLRQIGIVREREVNTFKVQWQLITGMSVLRGPVDFPSSYIPIVPVFGRQIRARKKTRLEGLIRHAKDPKRADNVWLTAATERVAMAPKAPWLLTAKQVEGYESDWINSNKGTPAALFYNADPAVPGAPKRQDPPAMPVAELQMAAAMTEKVKSTIGMYDTALGQEGQEVSGKAIMARQRESDTGTFVFPSNLRRAVAQVGRILVDMIPQVYDSTRIVTARWQDGNSTQIELNSEMFNQEGEKVVINDLSVGSFDIVVRSGPGFSTQRAEAVEALIEFVRIAPEIGAVILDKLAGAMDWPGADEIARRLKLQLPRHLLTDDEKEEIPEPPVPEPTPAEQAEMMKAEADMESAKASQMMAEAKTVEAQVKMAEINARASEDELMQRVSALIEETMTEVMVKMQQGGSE